MPRITVHVAERTVTWQCRDHREHLGRYVESLDSKYFDYLLQTHCAAFEEGDYKEHAAMALRQLYMQVLETTMAVLCCTLQAPGGLPMYMLTYDNRDLKAALKSLKQGERLPGALAPFELEAYAGYIVSGALHPDGTALAAEEITEAIPLLVRSLEYLIDDFLEQDFHDEYNSIKHGHRATSGGLQLVLRMEGATDSVKLKMPYGSHFPRRVPRFGKGEARIEYHSLGYSPRQTAQRASVAIGILNLHLALLTVHITQKTGSRTGHIPHAETLHQAWLDQSDLGSLPSMTNSFF